MENVDVFMKSESPFLNITSFEEGKNNDGISQNESPIRQTPFMHTYDLDTQELLTSEVQAFRHDLFDQEFEDSVENLIFETRLQFEHQLEHLQQEQGFDQVLENNLQMYFMPLEREVDHLFSRLTPLAEAYDEGEMSQEDFVKRMQEINYESSMNPVFEDFLGKLWKKAKKFTKKAVSKVKSVAKKGIALAKKFGLGFLINKLKGIAMVFLKSIINKIMGKIPVKYQGLAQKLATRLGVRRELEAPSDTLDDLEIDQFLSELVHSQNEFEADHIQCEMEQSVNVMVPDEAEIILRNAREKLVEQLSELQDEEQVGPVIEQFIGSALSVLRWGIKIIGRERVKKQLVNILTALVGRYIGRRNALVLTTKIVDYGFGALNLEAASENFASEAVAGVVEDTLMGLRNLDNYQLEDLEIFQAEVVSAFEAAAAKGLPDILTEAEYEENPDLRESFLIPTMWKLKKIGKGIGKYRYRKNSKIFHKILNPKVLDRIKTFGEKNLKDVLATKLGITKSGEIPANIHLFELLPGSSIQDIAYHEFSLPESERRMEDLIARFHPLTTRSAGLLLGDPDLGCKNSCSCLRRDSVKKAHRVFYLDIPGVRLQRFEFGGQINTRSLSDVKILKDQSGTRVHFYFSEMDAQKLSDQIKNGGRGDVIKFLTDRLFGQLTEENRDLDLVASKHLLGKFLATRLMDLSSLDEAINDPADGISIIVQGTSNMLTGKALDTSAMQIEIFSGKEKQRL